MLAPLVLAAVDFMNFTYAANPCSQNVPVPVVMKRGSFDYYDRKAGNGFELSVSWVKEGSLAPGTRQAVVEIVCDFPADGGAYAAYLFDENGNQAKFAGEVAKGAWGIDWGGRPGSVHVRFTNKFLYVDRCKDDSCSAGLVTTYAVRNGKIVKVFEQVHAPPKD